MDSIRRENEKRHLIAAYEKKFGMWPNLSGMSASAAIKYLKERLSIEATKRDDGMSTTLRESEENHENFGPTAADTSCVRLSIEPEETIDTMNSVGVAYIAHPGQSLEDHLRGVGEKSKKFADKIGLHEHGELLGLLHDIGKYSQQFQSYIKSATGMIDPDEDEYVDSGVLKGKIDHSTAGAQFIWENLSSLGPMESMVAQILSLCVASHHSGMIDCLAAGESDIGVDNFSRRMAKSRDKTHLDEVLRVADKAVLARCHEILSSGGLSASLKEKMAGIAAAGNVSGRVHCLLVQLRMALLARYLFSCLIDADRIDTADSERRASNFDRPAGNYVPWPVLIDRLEQKLNAMPIKNPIDSIRRDISTHCLQAATRGKGIYSLTVPTGGGKTLASLRFALHHAQQRGLDRIIYVIPFTSIIDQNAQVVRQILEPDDVPEESGKIVLEHHSSVTPERQTWREKILCESWDAPIVYTTMVQLLEALFGAGTRGARRMHQLANAVLVFDEIQTLPVRCVHMFNSAINFLAEQCNSTVVLCTATQPLLGEVDPTKGAIRFNHNHRLMPDEHQLFDDLKRVNVIDKRMPGGWGYEQCAELALDEVKSSGSCLIIVNTKDSAREIYSSLHAMSPDHNIYHLSTGMCPFHRKAVLAIIRQKLEKGEPILCVSTQLIEAGVDVDFGSVIRSLAGLDSIAQAAGRCNRNGRRNTGAVHVVNLKDERVGNLVDIAKGQMVSERVLDDFKQVPERFGHDLIGPQALRDYYQYYFFERQKDMSYPIAASSLGHDDTLLNLLSENVHARTAYIDRNGEPPKMPMRQAFMQAAKAFKAIDAPTQGIIVPFGEEGRMIVGELGSAFEVDKQFGLLKRAQQFTVNVFPHVYERLIEEKAIYPVQEGVNIMRLDERYYSNDFGLVAEEVSSMHCGVI